MATVGSLAKIVDGTVVGDASIEIRNVADLASAGPSDITFLANPKYAGLVAKTRAGALLVAQAVDGAPCAQVLCANPYLAMATVATTLNPVPSYPAGVEAGAHVHAEAQVDRTATIRVGAIVERGAVIGARSVIWPGAYVGPGARVGDDSVLHPGVKVLHGCSVGARCILHAGVVIGSDGFGYAPDAKGTRHKIPQVGVVVVDDDVEIGANTTVDRATFGMTRIGRGTKIDNLVQIAHNVVTGRDCVIVSQSGIAGSATLGDRVVMGAQTGVVGHVKIANDVTLAGRAAAASGIDEAGVYSGAPAFPHRAWLKSVVTFPELPNLKRRVRELEARIAQLEGDPSDHASPTE
jgi:UDP-3-O-[3-hydroxymyristoyl] glucosamine N-acyltransferase